MAQAAFEPLWQATMTRTVVGFGYRGVQRGSRPFLTYRRGSWYLLGLDRTRRAPRIFKLARLEANRNRWASRVPTNCRTSISPS